MITRELSIETKVILFVIFASIFRAIYVSGLNLMPDEAYYFLWSKHLAFSYFDHPPMIAYLFALFNLIISHQEFVVRLVSILLMAFTSVYAFLLAKELFDRRTALYYIFFLNITPLFMGSSIIATPDTPMTFFLTGASYYFYLAVKREDVRFWLLSGIFVGLSLLSKYIAVLIYPSFLLYLLLKENRKWLKKKILYLSFLISVIIFLPVILWNYAHNWVSFGFQLGHGLGGKFPNWKRFGEFIGGQAGIVSPILFVLFLTSILYLLVRWRRVSLQDKFLFVLASVPFFFFLASSLQKKVEANWPAFAYLPGILLVMSYYRQRLAHKKWGQILWRTNWILTGLILSILLIHIYIPFLGIKKDRTDEFFGWDSLGDEVSKLQKENPTFLLAANRHQIASEIEFYSGNRVACFNLDSRPNQYDLWQDKTSFKEKNFLFFDKQEYPAQAIANTFKRLEFLKAIPLKRKDKTTGQIFVYRAYNYN